MITRRLTLALVLAAAPAAAQDADSARSTTLTPGVTHTHVLRPDGPWSIHVLRMDLGRADLAVRQVRAHDRLTSRERVSAMVARRAATGEQVIAAVNADFFDLATGASENNVVIDGEWWRGIRVTDSPYDTFDNIHAQLALDRDGQPLVDRFAFDGWVRAPRASFPLIALNAMPGGTYEGTALWTPRAGPTTPRDTARATSELSLAPAGRRADTLLYVRRGASKGGGSDIPPDGVVLAAYGARTVAVDSTTDGDTLRITLGAAPWPPPARASVPSLLIGGWPRILHGGASVAGRASADEGTISRNAEVRHPRTAVGVTRDRKTLLLVTVDGRSAASVGMTLVELADFMKSLGAWDALNFDGGGSTTMVIGDRVVNTPSDRTGEREVGSALFIVKRDR